MDYYNQQNRDYGFYEAEEDPYNSTSPRASSVNCVDAVLPWRFKDKEEEEEEEEEPLPPPVPPKNELRTRAREARSAAVSSSPSPSPSIPERVTPWLLRRVRSPIPDPAPRKQKPSSSSTRTADTKRGGFPPKSEPPAYHAVLPPPPPPPPPPPQQQRQQQQQQRQIHPSEEERLAIKASRGPTPTAVVQPSQQPVVQVQPRTPPKPAAAHHRSARGERGPTSHSGSPQLRSVRSAPHEERSRRPGTRAPPPPPLPRPSGLRTPASAGQVRSSERAHLVLPSYHSSQPFPSPAPPPYRASAEDTTTTTSSYPTSARSRSLPRSSRNDKHDAGRTFEKEAPPLPPLPLPQPCQPQLSSSAMSRIQAGRKVSKEFGDAIMQQELRLATPTLDHHRHHQQHSRLDDRPVPNPRLGRRFLSASELQSNRKAKLGKDRITPEHEARLRTLNNKSSPNVGRCSGDSRQRTVSAHPGPGRGQEKGTQRGRR